MRSYFHQPFQHKPVYVNNRDFSLLRLEPSELQTNSKLSYLGKLQSDGIAWWVGEFEELLRHHPGLQSFQLAGS